MGSSFGEGAKPIQSGDDKSATATMKQFITIWPTIEGMLARPIQSLHARRERIPGYYGQGERKGLSREITSLDQGPFCDRYDSFLQHFDAMLILLREG